MMELKAVLVSSLEKVFPDQEPKPLKNRLSGLLNERVSFQLAYKAVEYGYPNSCCVRVASAYKDCFTIRRVGLIPSLYPATTNKDENYIKTTPGLYPDVLFDTIDGRTRILPDGHWLSLWIDFEPERLELSLQGKPAPSEIAANFEFYTENNELLTTVEVNIELIPAKLPAQKLIHTEWFHGDCLADYYEVPVFSERHWEILGNFIEAAAKATVNMILTPLFTPPLDTAVGGDRTTIQLVDVIQYVDRAESITGKRYEFGFDKLRRWVALCKSKGMIYFEMSHLFSQWGARYAPKIMAKPIDQKTLVAAGGYENFRPFGEQSEGNVGWEAEGLRKIFGWETAACSEEYKDFLDAFLPALVQELKALGIAENTYFHVSDEPSEEHLESYGAAKALLEKHIQGFKLIDALSSFEFYKHDLVEKPIPCLTHIHPFLEAKVPGLWTYYCVSQGVKVSNRFVSMPSARNRILGVQLYKFNIEGFLQWGFNFYNSQYSLEHINPFFVTDADCAFPTGDSFLVYPGRGGRPLDSIRLMVFAQGQFDLRALALLESLTSREFVLGLAEESGSIEFDSYPTDEGYLLGLRERVNEEIKKRV